MVDQVNLTGSLATGSSPSYSVVKPTQPLKENAPVAMPPTSQVAKPAGQEKPASFEMVQAAAQALSKYLQVNQPDLVFQVDRASGETYFKVVDVKTRKVIRQVPSEEVMAMARKLRELDDAMSASGVLVDKVG